MKAAEGKDAESMEAKSLAEAREFIKGRLEAEGVAWTSATALAGSAAFAIAATMLQ